MSTSHNSSSRDEAKRPSAQEKGNATQIQKPGEEDSHTLVAYDDAHLGAEAASEHPAERDDKSAVLAKDFRTMAKVSVVFILIVAGLALAGYLLKPRCAEVLCEHMQCGCRANSFELFRVSY